MTHKKKYAPGLLIAAITLACLLFILCFLNDRLPSSSGRAELLFPKHSKTLETLSLERRIFEDVYTDIIALRVDSDKDPFFLEDFQDELLALNSVESVITPQGDTDQDIFGLYSQDKRYARFIIKVSSSLTDEERKTLHKKLKNMLYKHPDRNPLRAGSFAAAQEVASVVSQETEAIIPWILGILIIAMLLLFKNILVSLIVISSTLCAISTSILSFSLFGYPLGPVSQLAPPFLLAVGTSFHLHFAFRYFTTPVNSREKVSRELFQSIGLAALTTASSLASLVLLDVIDVTRFAILAGGGTILSALYSCVLLSTLFACLKERYLSLPKIKPEFFLALKKPVVITILLCLTMLSAFGIRNLNIHTDPLSFLPSENITLKSINQINKIFSGNHYLSIILQAKENTKIINDRKFFRELKGRLLSLSFTERVISPIDFFDFYQNSSSKDFLSGFSVRESKIPADFYSQENNAYRILIETRVEGKDLLLLKEEILGVLKQMPAEEKFSIGITSLELILAEQTQGIVKGLIQSFLLVVGIVFLLLLFIFCRLVIACIGILPNIIPLLIVFGTLGFTLSNLDFGSCLVAASALGIAVDNTFHFLLCWKEQNKIPGSISLATERTVRLTVLPFCLTSFTLILSFFSMAYANSLPVAHFGILLAITLSVGLFSDLVVLPFFLSHTKAICKK